MRSGRKLSKLVCVLAFLSSMLIGAGMALADYQAGVDAYHNSDFQGAFQQWLPLAEQGDAQSQNALGALYDHGLGVDQDYVKAAYWYEKAAKQSFPLAMRNIGTLYANGHGVPLDLVQAKDWLQKAADAGDARSNSRKASRFMPRPW